MNFLQNFLMQGITLLLLMCGGFLASPAQTNSSLVYLNGGNLTYTPFAMKGQTNAVNTIPDFSYAGYLGGGVALPDVPVQQTISPVSGDDRQSIQDAIDAVEALTPDANGFRGAVLLTAGHYEVNGQLFIEASGVVLRGEGQGSSGTVIHANQTTQHDFLTVRGTGSGITEDLATTQRITTAYVPVGTMSFTIANAAAFSVGDTISVKRTPNQTWIDALGMGQTALCGSTPPPDCQGWTPASYTINHERIISGISGNTLTINIPVVDVMETQYGGGEVSKASIPGRIHNCGVENLRIESYYASNTDENHAWSAVRLSRVVNSWVKKVTAQYMGYGNVIIGSESNFNTVEECAAIDHKSQITGGRRYSFTIKDGVGNLFQRCYTREGRHDYEIASKVTGPNVFLDCYSANTYADIGPHHRWSTGTLFDNIRGGQMRVHNRGSSGTGHGWVAAQTLFWNLLSYKNDIKVSSPTGSRNWGIGSSGSTQNGDGFWEHWNNPVTPRSLYLQQLEDRLGTQAVDNIAIDEQQTGNIYSLLASWAGEGELITPPPSGTTINPIADAYVRGGTYVNDNFGTATSLAVKENSGTPDNDRQSFLKFDLSSISGNVATASIRLYVNNDDPGTTHDLHLVTTDSWAENTITWSNQPAAGSLLGSETVPGIGQWIEYDVASAVNAELSGDGTLTVRVSESTLDHYVTYDSREGTNAPQLVYQLAPASPSLSPSADAYVRAGSYGNDNFGTATTLVVKDVSGTGSYDRQSFLKFELSTISGSVATASIRLYVNNDDPGAIHNLHLVANDSWAENTITWNNQPTAGSLIGSATVPNIGQWIEYDVTSEVNAELSGDGTLTVRTSESTLGTYVTYYSREGANPPQLVYQLAPPPTSLSPSDDAYVRDGTYGNDNYGSNSQLIAKALNSTSYRRESYVKFDLSGISGNLLSAKVRLKVQNDDSGATHGLRAVSNDSWTEGSITWNNKPATGSTLATQTVPLIGEWIEFDVLSQAQTELSGDGTFSVNLFETSSNHYVGYHSSEAANAGDRPELLYTTDATARRKPDNQLQREKEFVVRQYPNPVTHKTAIFEFSLAEPRQVSLSVFSINGQQVKAVETDLNAGMHNWKVKLNLSPGVYIYRLATPQAVKNGKLMVGIAE